MPRATCSGSFARSAARTCAAASTSRTAPTAAPGSRRWSAMAARRTARWLPSLVGIVSLALAFLVLCALVPPAVPMLRLCGVWLAATAAALVSAILAGLLANRTWVSVACLALYPASPARAVLLSAQVVAALPAAVVALWGGDRIAFLISGEGIGIFGVIILAPLVIALACPYPPHRPFSWHLVGSSPGHSPRGAGPTATAWRRTSTVTRGAGTWWTCLARTRSHGATAAPCACRPGASPGRGTWRAARPRSGRARGAAS